MYFTGSWDGLLFFLAIPSLDFMLFINYFCGIILE